MLMTVHPKLDVWINDTFENNLRTKHDFAKYLKGSFYFILEEHFSFKYFPKSSFVKEISPFFFKYSQKIFAILCIGQILKIH